MSTTRVGTAAAALLLAAASALEAQCDQSLVDEGVAAFRQLDLERATALLEDAVATGAPASTPCDAHARALVFLGATRLFTGDDAGAREAFRRLVVWSPRFEPDSLLFPPDVTELYRAVRRSTRAVAVEVADTTVLGPERDSLAVRLFPSTPHEVAVTLRSESAGAPAATLYRGPATDSMTVWWTDVRDRFADATGAARLTLQVASLDPAGTAERVTEVSLVATRRPGGAGGRESRWIRPAATGGLTLLGVGAVAMLPYVVGSVDGGTRGRFLVAGAVGVAGLVGALRAVTGARPAPAASVTISSEGAHR